MNEDIAACAGIVQKGDPDRFMAIMSGPLSLREKLFPLYAMNVEVSRAPWVTKEPMIAEMRLQWWLDALEEIASAGVVRRHEVVTPLASILSASQAELLQTLVRARRWDIYSDPFEDEQQFQIYLEETSGLLLWVAAEMAGATHKDAILTIGAVDGLARWLHAAPELEEKGRVPLVDGRPQAIAALARQALENYQAARQNLGRQSPAVTAVLRSTWQAKSLLKHVAAQPECVANGGMSGSLFKKKFSLLWKSVTANW